MIKLLIFIIILNWLIYFLNNKILIVFIINLIFILSFIFILNFNYRIFVWMRVYNWIGLDWIRIILVLLTLWILGLMYFSRIRFKNLKLYRFILLSLIIFLRLSFIRINYFIFYLFFEISLIPTFLLILGWGYQPERINARIYILLYTMFASLPLLILLFFLYDYFDSLRFFFLINKKLIINFNSFILYFYMLFAFLVKLPIFFFSFVIAKGTYWSSSDRFYNFSCCYIKIGRLWCYAKFNNYN